MEKITQCCADRSLLEIVLGAVTVILILLVVTLLTREGTPNFKRTKNICKTPKCLREASRILLHIDPNINPCEDFYKFACGNFHNNADEAETLSVTQRFLQQLVDIYKEPISYREHKMVRAAKQLFQTCLDEAEIERDGLKIMKEDLEEAGGWPLLDGSKWDEANFDWIRATYRLRELGYYHSCFLQLDVVIDPQDIRRKMLQVSPSFERFHYPEFGILEFMIDIATKLGAVNRTLMQTEILNMYQFMKETEFSHKQEEDKPFQKYTVDEYQQKCGSINWLSFINTIIGPKIQITKDDHVIFPHSQIITRWLNLISKTPKRNQANYMMWKVVEDSINYLGGLLNDTENNYRHFMTREEFCLSETQGRYQPNPIIIMWYRKFLPTQKKILVEELLLNMKLELVDAIDQIDWMDAEDKSKVSEKAEGLTLLIDQPKNYLDDKSLNDLDVDMKEITKEPFLRLITQAKRNQQSTIFSKLKKPVSETETPKRRQFSTVVSAIATHFFDDNRPQYLNYGVMGTVVGYEMSKVLTTTVKNLTKAKDIFESNLWCLINNTTEPGHVILDLNLQKKFMTLITMGEQISYGAYDKWAKLNGKEQMLVGTDYTSKQLFWISAVSTLCEPSSIYNFKLDIPQGNVSVSNWVLMSLRNNPNFAKDFECPVESKMNPSEKCHIL